MPNLVCFPHYTCGGLLCDIMAGSFSNLAINGGISSIQHAIGKIGDTDTVMIDYNVDELMRTIASKNLTSQDWVGTHCWPGQLPLNEFNQLLVITTTTFKSKIYRWARAHHHYFAPQWKNLSGMELIDKSRETAKNYLVSYKPLLNKPNVLNVEFADVVENTPEFYYAIGHRECAAHLQRWKQVNYFLYSENFWTSSVVDYFYQAEAEANLNRYYRYH